MSPQFPESLRDLLNTMPDSERDKMVRFYETEFSRMHPDYAPLGGQRRMSDCEADRASLESMGGFFGRRMSGTAADAGQRPNQI